MRRFLVVANQTLGGAHLTEAVRDRAAAGDCSFYVVVPATAPAEELVAHEGPVGSATKLPSAGEFAHAIAEQRLATALKEIRGVGGVAEGEVGDPDPLDAVRGVLERQQADEIIISTLPLGMSRWLRRDLPTQVKRATGLPVTHIVGEEIS